MSLICQCTWRRLQSTAWPQADWVIPSVAVLPNGPQFIWGWLLRTCTLLFGTFWRIEDGLSMGFEERETTQDGQWNHMFANSTVFQQMDLTGNVTQSKNWWLCVKIEGYLGDIRSGERLWCKFCNCGPFSSSTHCTLNIVSNCHGSKSRLNQIGYNFTDYMLGIYPINSLILWNAPNPPPLNKHTPHSWQIYYMLKHGWTGSASATTDQITPF